MTEYGPGQLDGQPERLDRRTLVAGVAWSVPAVVMAAAAPAFAVSGDVLTLSTSTQRVRAAGAETVTARLTNAAGVGRSGSAVSFSGPSGATFTPISATTDSSGGADTSLDLGTPWAAPGSSVSISAVSSSATTSRGFTVVGANAYAAGRNASGQFGNGSTTDLTTPAQLPLVFASRIVQIALGGGFSLALLEDGTVWSSGTNTSGQLGDGTTASRTTWALVPGLSAVDEVAAGSHSGYARVGGIVYGWGRNNSGQLGDGSTTNRTSPVLVSGLSSGVAQIVAAGSSAHARLTSGGLKSWGLNNFGQLGDATTTNRVTPVDVVGMSSGVSRISSAPLSCFALIGGRIRAWGYGLDGQLGDGTSVNRSTAVEVSGLSAVTHIATSTSTAYARTSGGTVYAWGRNDKGQVGDGTTANRARPVAVQGLSSGATLVAGGFNGGYALANGVVKAWGENRYGELGDGTTTVRTSPVNVSTVSNVTGLPSASSGGGGMFFLR